MLASVRGESLRMTASQAEGAPARIVRSVATSASSDTLVASLAADVDDPHADAFFVPALTDRLGAGVPPALAQVGHDRELPRRDTCTTSRPRRPLRARPATPRAWRRAARTPRRPRSRRGASPRRRGSAERAATTSSRPCSGLAAGSRPTARPPTAAPAETPTPRRPCSPCSSNRQSRRPGSSGRRVPSHCSSPVGLMTGRARKKNNNTGKAIRNNKSKSCSS